MTTSQQNQDITSGRPKAQQGQLSAILWHENVIDTDIRQPAGKLRVARPRPQASAARPMLRSNTDDLHSPLALALCALWLDNPKQDAV